MASDLIFTLSTSSSIDSLDSMSEMIDSLDLNGIPKEEKKKNKGLYGISEKPSSGMLRMGGFILKDTIARGLVSTIKTAIGPDQKSTVVLKLIDRGRLTKKGIPTDQILQESALELLKYTRHPNIVQVAKFKVSSTQIAIVMEALNPRPVATVIASPSISHTFNELSCQIILAGLASAIDYIHKKNFILRSLNHENVLLADGTQPDPAFWRPKLVGFGFMTPNSPPPTSKVGSKLFIAPEMETGNYSEKVDIFALGVYMFLIMTGLPPQFSPEGVIQFYPSLWKRYHYEGTQMIEKMMSFNPSERPSADLIVHSSWMKKPGETSGTEAKHILKVTLDKFATDSEQIDYVRVSTKSSGFNIFSWKKKESKKPEEVDDKGRVKVAEVGDQSNWPKNIHKVKVRGTSIALFYANNKFWALANSCVHAAGPLDQGDIEDVDGSPCARCPIHGFKFNLETGYTKTKKYKQKVFPVTIHNDSKGKSSVWIDL